MWSIIFSAYAEPVADRVLDAVGETESEVVLPRFGRYAFEVRSEVGTALTVVDRMEGPSRQTGRVGERDGRYDGFFDVGEAKVRLEAPSDGRGKANVTVTAFDEIGTDEALVRYRPVLTELDDKQARSWWIEAGAERIQIEVVGRYLGDVRLWLQGSWLVDAEPSCAIWEPVDGQPLTRCVLDTRLEPGLYRMVAYGGEGNAWANDAQDSFLSVRWDAPQLPPVGSRVGRIGPTGTDYFRVSDVGAAHLTLPEIQPAELALNNVGAVFGRFQGDRRITDESRTPEVTATSGTSKEQVITVSGTPGQRYHLSWFDPRQSVVEGSGQVLVTSMSTARPSDTLSPTALFVRRLSNGKSVLAHSAALRLKAGTRFQERFNLLARNGMLVELPEELDVRFRLTEGQGSIRFEPFFTSPPEGYRAPKARSGEWVDRHPAGTYVLTLEPDEPGIATLELAANGWSDVAQEKTSGLREITLPAGIREVIDFDRGAPLRVSSFFPPDSKTGLVVRDLPLDPHDPVPIPLRPQERFKLPVRVTEPTTVRALLPNGEPLPLELFEQSTVAAELPAGSFALTIHNDTDEAVVAVVGADPDPEPVARVPRDRITALPEFELLTASEPHYTDLERSRSETLKLEVDDDGLYLLESTGLLATRGSLRSRVKLSLGEGSTNGVGRNFRIGRYLRSGTYQVTVGTQGQTKGHLGVTLRQAALAEGGPLELDRIARATVPAGDGVAYDLELDAPRYVRIRSSAPSQSFPCRLEDEDGYPVVRPTNTCDLRVQLKPGRYRLISAPIDVDSKRHTVAETDQPPEPREGHGPHELLLGRRASHVWVEPPGDGERPTDLWTFTLPADLHVDIDAGDEMAGTLLAGDEPLARLTPGRAWKGPLKRGIYTLKLQAARRGTGIPYQVRVQTDALTAGQRRGVQLPAVLSLAIGQAGPVTLTSNGDADVRARLVDADGLVVTANDDRPDDWNFRISQWLEPGTYRLELDRVGNHRHTVVEVAAPQEVEGEPLATSRRPTNLPIGEATTVHALDAGKEQTLRIRATSNQNVSLAVEQKTPEGWTSLGSAAGRTPSLLARRSPGAEVRVRLGALDGRTGTAEVQIQGVSARAVRARAVSEGVLLADLGAFSGRNLTPGLYRIGGDRSELFTCPQVGEPCTPAPAVAAVSKQTLFFGRSLQLERAALDREPVPVGLSAKPQALQTGLDGTIAIELRSQAAAGVSLAEGTTVVTPGGALALGTGDVSVWGEGVGRVRAVQLQVAERTWDDEDAVLELPPRTLVKLPSKAKRLAVALEPGSVATRGDQALWADADALAGTLGGKGPIGLANLGDAPVQVRIRSVEPIGTAPEVRATRAGTDVRVVDASDLPLHVARAELIYLRKDGRVLKGTSVETGPGGIAWVTHGPGWHAIWLGPGPWTGARNATLPVDPGVHEVQLEEPFAARIGDRVYWRPEGGAVRFRLAKKDRLAVRGLEGEVQPTIRPLAAPTLGEGLGPEVLLDAGGSAWFQLQVDEAGPLGFGVRAAADRVAATLYDDAGNALASGVVRKVELEPGRYWLELSQGADAAPVRARPAIAGLDRPDRGPPSEVVKNYLEAAGLVAGGAR